MKGNHNTECAKTCTCKTWPRACKQSIDKLKDKNHRKAKTPSPRKMEEDELRQSKTFNKISLQFNNMLKIIDKYLQRVEKKSNFAHIQSFYSII